MSIEVKSETQVENIAQESSVEETTTSQEFDKKILLIENTFKAFKDSFRTQIVELKKMKKEMITMEKANDKLTKKKKKSVGESGRKSGFSKPVAISKELSEFLGKEPGTTISRSEVTKAIGAYVRDHKLSNPENGREFLLNKSAESKRLESLLDQTNKGEKPLGYFNLQKCIKHHFIKTAPADAVVEEAAPKKVVEKKVETPKVEKAAKVETPKVEKAAKVETPKVETKTEETPKPVMKKKIIRKKV